MKDKIEKLKLIQADGQPHPCPRCGTGSASKRTALSRYADVYICDECGTDEAIRDAAGNPMPLDDWNSSAALAELDTPPFTGGAS